MANKNKTLKKCGIPEYVIERIARCVLDDIRADYTREDVQVEFAAWMTERERGKNRKR